MSLKSIYNNIAHQYDTANRFQSISKSHQIAIDQIKKHCQALPHHFRVLDLGVGDGSFLKQLHDLFPHGDFTGVDLSSEMLQLAKQQLPLVAIESSASEAHHYLPPHSQNLTLAHFINAYIPIETLFAQAKHLTRGNGYYSMITTTYDSFPEAQRQLAQFIAQDTLVSSVVGHYYKAIVKNTTVASGLDELLENFKNHDFHIIEHKRLEIPITLNNIDELANFGIEGTWFLNSLSVRMLPKNFLLQRLKRLFGKIFEFPYHDKHVIDVILAKK